MVNKQEHPQAKWLRAIADGKTLQDCNTPMGTYVDVHFDAALERIACSGTMNTFRIKPQTITIGKYEVAEPMKVEPEKRSVYFVLTALEAGCVFASHWDGDPFDHDRLKSGMCWLKREDAELAAKAITELLTGK